ncbi:DDE-type integrase/transposase/recombinase [Streptomyces sp. LHD-70]|uniref:Mu transposase C-terminal domain-containing protein n=1 Tax=Streptomyces sp. LHD-70 TaxID=3072140 RepID=UPI00280D038B|nr:Mu transposase C-terminal domain-containing protein [Streptomyces sp. LHD-70]MDQ8708324.1 DDE-type integrase/transposase/recombinase [Streptomyces sp. LHD-70]
MRWQVVALSGQQVHLVGEEGADEVLLAGYLFADPGFAVLGAEAERAQAVPQWGLFETAPAAAREKALAWQRHIREVECGRPGGADSSGQVRAEYDPDRWTLAEREQAKARELTSLGFGRVSRSTVQRMRLAYRKQGLWGLIDHRTARSPKGGDGGGRQDERVVAAVKDVLRGQRGRSKGTVKALMPLVAQLLKDRHGDTVPMPAQATFYRLVNQLAHPADHPAHRVRSAPLTDDGHRFTPTVALRPGEQVQIDTTRLDVLALYEDGSLGRPELTIAVDVATRAILAAVLCPGGTQAVDAALLLAEMAVPHPARPTWPDVLHFAHNALLPGERLLSLDERLEGAAARPVVVPETVVVDRGKVFVSRAFTGACEALGISVQAAPPFAPTAKGIVERTFGSINTLFCQHLPGYTGSDVTRRGKDVAREACYSVAQLQDLLDEWLVHWHHRPHEGLRHPVLPKTALSPNQMWAALVSVAGHIPVPLSGADYLELLPVRWQAITEHGIRLHHRTYDHDLLGPHRGKKSEVAARGGKWEVHTNPHDVRQIWVRLPDHGLTEIPWIHRDHSHQPFNDRTWKYLQTITTRHADHDGYEADLAEALDQLMRRTRTGTATRTEKHLLARHATTRTPPPVPGDGPDTQARATGAAAAVTGEDSLDELDQDEEDPAEGEDETPGGPAVPVAGYGLYDAQEEALKW